MSVKFLIIIPLLVIIISGCTQKQTSGAPLTPPINNQQSLPTATQQILCGNDWSTAPMSEEQSKAMDFQTGYRENFLPDEVPIYPGSKMVASAISLLEIGQHREKYAYFCSDANVKSIFDFYQVQLATKGWPGKGFGHYLDPVEYAKQKQVIGVFIRYPYVTNYALLSTGVGNPNKGNHKFFQAVVYDVRGGKSVIEITYLNQLLLSP